MSEEDIKEKLIELFRKHDYTYYLQKLDMLFDGDKASSASHTEEMWTWKKPKPISESQPSSCEICGTICESKNGRYHFCPNYKNHNPSEKDYDDPDIEKYKGNRKEWIKWTEQGDKEVAEPIIKAMAGFQWIHDGKMYMTVEKADLEVLFKLIRWNSKLDLDDTIIRDRLEKKYLKEEKE